MQKRSCVADRDAGLRQGLSVISSGALCRFVDVDRGAAGCFDLTGARSDITDLRDVDAGDVHSDVSEWCVGTDGNEAAGHILNLADAARLGELIYRWDVDHPPATIAADFDLVVVHHFRLLSSMALLILRTTPGLIARWLSGTGTHTPDRCVHLECRPSVLIRVKPASFNRLITDLVGSSFTTTIV